MVGGHKPAELSGMNNEYVLTQRVMADGGDRFGVCALAFDQTEELLWMGNEGVNFTDT